MFIFSAPGWETATTSTTGVAETSSEGRGASTVEQAKQDGKREATRDEKNGVTGILVFKCTVLNVKVYNFRSSPRRGESWSAQRGSRAAPRHEYRDNYRGRERYSPAGGYDAPAAAKRMRHDW